MATPENHHGGARPPDIRDFIFVRELAEVYLLLDHISGRWDKPLDKEGEKLRAAVCAIGWPANGSRQDAAEQAAILLRAKDRLNALARPASGATIAFTLLVVGEEDPRRHHRRWWSRLWPWFWARRRGRNQWPAPSGEPAPQAAWDRAAAVRAVVPAPAGGGAVPAAAPFQPAAGEAELPAAPGAAFVPASPGGAAVPGAPAPSFPPAASGGTELSAVPVAAFPPAPSGEATVPAARPPGPSCGAVVTAMPAHGAGPSAAAVAPAPPPFTGPVNGELIVPGCGFTRPPTRMSLARTAFPGLIGPAGQFNRGIWRIVAFLVSWMVLTCVLSWDITAGNVVLAHLDTLRAQQGELARKISAAEAADELARRNKAGAAAAADVPPVLFCDPVTQRFQRKYRTVEELQLCTDKERLENERLVTQRNLHVWIKPWEKLYRLVAFEPARAAPTQTAAGTPDLAGPYGGDEEPARVLTHVIGCAVLPLCYGILGAGAAAVRNLWAKLRESMLMPRDYTLALGQLALGATIGACIGLFVNPAGSASGADAALATSWTLSGSALSFIAGFGVEGVFLALEAFVRRVFGVASAPRPPE